MDDGCIPDVLAKQRDALGISSHLNLLENLLHLERAVVPLNRCANLAPAGTGTMFLYEHLRAMPAAAVFIRHDHSQRIGPSYPPSSASTNGRRCAMITLREPSERLASGMRYDANSCRLTGYMSRSYKCLFSPSGFNSSSNVTIIRVRHSCCAVPLSAWIEGLRSDSSAGLHEGSIAALSQRIGHNHFLVPQIDYLRGIQQCGMQTELHVLCTESLSRDWGMLLSQHGGVEARAAAANKTAHTVINRHSVSSNSLAWQLSKDDRAYWNKCLAPWDARLHKHFCGKEGGIKSFLVPPPADCPTRRAY